MHANTKRLIAIEFIGAPMSAYQPPFLVHLLQFILADLFPHLVLGRIQDAVDQGMRLLVYGFKLLLFSLA